MRGDHQTSDRRRRPRSAWAWVAAVALAATAANAEAEDAADGPVQLAADRIVSWDEDGRRWVVLEGRVAILRGMRGLRADRAVVRLSGVAGEGTKTSAVDVEVFAEGQVRSTDGATAPRPSAREAYRVDAGAALKPYSPAGLSRLAQPPARSPLVARAFPKAPPRVVREVAARDIPAREPAPPKVAAAAPVDRQVRPAQLGIGQDAFPDDEGPAPMLVPQPPADDAPGMVDDPPPAELPVAIPGGDLPNPDPNFNSPDQSVLVPGTQRIWSISPRDAGPNFSVRRLESTERKSVTFVIRGGVNITGLDPKQGVVDISSDNLVVWTEADEGGGKPGENGAQTDAKTRLEIYAQGNVICRQDARKVAGNGDQKTFLAERFYYDFRTDRAIAQDAEIQMYTQGLLAPVRTRGPELNQFTEAADPKTGQLYLDPKTRKPRPLTRIRADDTSSTGSRFPNPGYRFDSQSVDLLQRYRPLRDPLTGQSADRNRDGLEDLVWQLDARQNVYYVGGVPLFYWPHVVQDADDLDPVVRNIGIGFGNYFGYHTFLDLSGTKLLNLAGMKKPRNIGTFNVDVDYLSKRGPALGTEIDWSGKDPIRDFLDPFNTGPARDIDLPYFGYYNVWGIIDNGIDVLGTGPAIVTNGPPGAGKRRYQRNFVPPFQQLRGKLAARHMQSLLPSDAPEDEDLRLQLEVGYQSDRYFLEEYYKRLFDSGLDESTLAYLIRQKQNRAFTVLAEANLNPWNTQTQWLPRFEYYRLGDSLFDRINYSTNNGVSYSNTQTANEVNNPNIFAFIPYDPTSNTHGPLKTGRAYTTHEFDAPVDFGALRIVPYAQGQAMGYDNQINGQPLGRLWGAAGMKANVMLWKAFPEVENELLNVHGLNHKINFDVDYRTAYSNVPLNKVGVLDTIDDNSYESTRRYFALTNYIGGILPPQYDPRFLTLRRAISPIAGTNDIQGTIQTVKLGIHQRLQTHRGREGNRRVIDWMVFDVTSTYFPDARRDNFAKSFGQTQYNYEWYLGDRTSIISNGWFEFWDVQGSPILISNPRQTNNPFGLNVINTGISINRPPRSNIYASYSIINTGPISTSAGSLNYSYWMSPKWFSSVSSTYDFGNKIWLGAALSVTRIGADFLTSVGLTFDPQRNNTTFALEVTPRLSPNVRFGSTTGFTRFDPRFAPTQ